MVLASSTLCPNRSLMFLILYLIMVGRSRLKPHAITRTFCGNPIGASISGRNIPELPISVHFFRSGWYPNIYMDGSVYGLKAGLKRSSVMPIFLKNVSMVPMRSPRLRL